MYASYENFGYTADMPIWCVDFPKESSTLAIYFIELKHFMLLLDRLIWCVKIQYFWGGFL